MQNARLIVNLPRVQGVPREALAALLELTASCLLPQEQRSSCGQLAQATAALRVKHGVPSAGQPFTVSGASLLPQMPHALFPFGERRAEEQWQADEAAFARRPQLASSCGWV